MYSYFILVVILSNVPAFNVLLILFFSLIHLKVTLLYTKVITIYILLFLLLVVPWEWLTFFQFALLSSDWLLSEDPVDVVISVRVVAAVAWSFSCTFFPIFYKVILNNISANLKE